MTEAFKIGLNRQEWLELTPRELQMAINARSDKEFEYFDFFHRLQTGKPLKKGSKNSAHKKSIIDTVDHIAQFFINKNK